MRNLIVGALLTGAAMACSPAPMARAQTLGDVGASMALGASMDAAAMHGMPDPKKLTSKVQGESTPHMPGENGEADSERAYGGTRSGSGRAAALLRGPSGAPNPGSQMGGAGYASGPTSVTFGAGMPVKSAPIESGAIKWGSETGADFINQLLAGGTYSPARAAHHRFSIRHARGHHAAHHATTYTAAAYHPPATWLSHYIPDDQYRLRTGGWQFVSTETDRYYYRPDAPGMLRQSPNRVIGFVSWQDAMIAGYRPDPFTKPDPGYQLAHIARIGRCPELEAYAELIYSGQVTPTSFDTAYRYLLGIERAVDSRAYTRPLLAGTIQAALGFVLGRNDPPGSVGIQDTAAGLSGAGGPGGPNGDSATTLYSPGATNVSDQGSGGSDKREEDFNTFGSRAGSLAATGAERNRKF